jgi:hypothetical protein
MFIRVNKIGQHEFLSLVNNVREGERHVERGNATTRLQLPREPHAGPPCVTLLW